MTTNNPMQMAYKRLGRTNFGGEEVQIKGCASDFIINYEELVTPTAEHTVPAKFIISLH